MVQARANFSKKKRCCPFTTNLIRGRYEEDCLSNFTLFLSVFFSLVICIVTYQQVTIIIVMHKNQHQIILGLKSYLRHFVFSPILYIIKSMLAVTCPIFGPVLYVQWCSARLFCVQIFTACQLKINIVLSECSYNCSAVLDISIVIISNFYLNQFYNFNSVKLTPPSYYYVGNIFLNKSCIKYYPRAVKLSIIASKVIVRISVMRKLAPSLHVCLLFTICYFHLMRLQLDPPPQLLHVSIANYLPHFKCKYYCSLICLPGTNLLSLMRTYCSTIKPRYEVIPRIHSFIIFILFELLRGFCLNLEINYINCNDYVICELQAVSEFNVFKWRI